MAKVGGIETEYLEQYVTRIERLMEEKDGLARDITEAFAEAKANGFDAPAIRQVIKERKLSAQERQEREALLDTYRRALQLTFDFAEERSSTIVGGGRLQADIEDYTGRPVAA